MQEHSTTDLTDICYDVTKQRSLFLCIFGSCQPRYYGPALASAIISCSGRGANISPLLPVEIQSEKLSGRQISEDSGDSGSISSPDINNEGIDHKLTLALSCNAGPDGVVTVSLSSPPTFATHIPDAARFPDDLLSRLGLGGSSTSVGSTVTQPQGRPPLPTTNSGQLTAYNSDQGGQAGQRGQAGSASAMGMDRFRESCGDVCETNIPPINIEFIHNKFLVSMQLVFHF
ncbi:hypothetical protein MY4038_006887 [Beauveria bassiana]